MPEHFYSVTSLCFSIVSFTWCYIQERRHHPYTAAIFGLIGISLLAFFGWRFQHGRALVSVGVSKGSEAAAAEQQTPAIHTPVADAAPRTPSDDGVSTSTSVKRQRESPASAQPRRDLQEEYDALLSRFNAVEAVFRRAAQDLGTQPMKPEIASALKLAPRDLAAAKAALMRGDWDAASRRLQRVKATLKFLEEWGR